MVGVRQPLQLPLEALAENGDAGYLDTAGGRAGAGAGEHQHHQCHAAEGRPQGEVHSGEAGSGDDGDGLESSIGDGIPEGHPRLHPQIDAQQQRGRRHDTDVDPQFLAAEHLLQLAANGQKHQGEIHAGQEGEHRNDPHDRLGRAR